MQYPVNSDEYFMNLALKEAQAAFSKDEVPIGAVVVHNNKIVAKGYNLTETLQDVTAHAEMQAMTAATNQTGGKYLEGCTVYVTIEPCMMCAGAMYWFQIDKLVFGATDKKRGYSTYGKIEQLHPKTTVISGVLEKDCKDLLQKFFIKKREQKLKKSENE
jgi:tRNA(adenine34) deaminase